MHSTISTRVCERFTRVWGDWPRLPVVFAYRDLGIVSCFLRVDLVDVDIKLPVDYGGEYCA